MDEARKYWAPLLPLPCSRCRKPVTRDMRWHVDHLRSLAEGGDMFDRKNQWPAHGSCNEGAGGRLAAQRAQRRRDGEKKIRNWL